jgi:hypothetical protein
MRTRAWVIAAAVALAACDHPAPFSVEDPEALGPSSPTLPLRLTFNPLEDLDPSSTADEIVFTRLEPGRSDLDRCLAFMPWAGGTLSRVLCAGGAHADSVTDAWLQPTVSDDGYIAYLRQQGRLGWVTPLSQELVVAPADAPDSAVYEVGLYFELEDGQRITAFRELHWLGDSAIRFVAGEDSFPRINGVWDTLFTPYALADLDLRTLTYREVPGTRGASSYVVLPNDAVWFVVGRELFHLIPGDTAATRLGSFSMSVTSLGIVDGLPVGVQAGVDESLIEWVDPETGMVQGMLTIAGGAGRIAGLPGTRRFVVELPGVVGPDLWLMSLP